MPDTIDSLELKISADAGSAAKNIDGLASSLLKLSGNLNSIDIGKLKSLSSVFITISDSAKTLKSALNTIDFSNLAGSKNALSKIIDQRTVDLMKNFGINSKTAFSEIRAGITQLEGDTARLSKAIKSATSVSDITEFHEAYEQSKQQLINSVREMYNASSGINSFKETYRSLVEYINSVNRSGNKIHVPFSSEFGEDWSRMRSSLGKAFTATGGGTDFEVFISQLNSELGNIIDTTKGAEGAFTDLYEKLRLGRGIVDDYNKAVLNIDSEPLSSRAINDQITPIINELERYRENMAMIGQDVDTQRENSELGNLRQAVVDVTNSVRSKIKAFQDEGKVVSSVVQSEVASLASLKKTIDRISTSISSMANSSNAFGGVGSSSGLQNLAGSVDGIRNLRTELVNLGTLHFDATGIRNIANAIAMLGRKNISSAINAIPNIASALRQLTDIRYGIGSIEINESIISNLERLASSISKLGSKSATNAASGNIISLANALREMMVILSSSPNVSNNIIRMADSLARLASSGSKAGAAARSLSKSFKQYSSATNMAQKSSKGLASVIGKLYASYFLLIRGASGIKNAIQSAMDLQETYNYFAVAMNKIGEESAKEWREAGYASAEAYADSFQERSKELTQKLTGYTFDSQGNSQYVGGLNMGMNPNEVMQYQAMYAQMANSIGLAGETAINTSKALTMLGADWASLRNISTDDAWMKLASALAGETEAVRKLGLDVTEATLQQTAYKFGIDQTVGSMDRATKIQLTLLSVLDQSRAAWGDMARTIESPANQFRVLTSNVANLARAIGSLFLPVISKVLPYINAFVIALQRLFSWLGSLLGVQTGQFTDSASSGLEDLVGAADDAASSLGDANEKADELKKTVLGFDELNQLNDQNKSTSSGGGGGIGGLGGGNPQLDAAISDLLDEYQKVWDEAFSEMSNKSEELADSITGAFKRIYDKIEPLRSALKNLWDAFKPFAQSVGRGLIRFLEDFGNLSINFGNEVVSPALNNIADSLRKVKPEDAEKLGYALGILASAIAGYKTFTWISGIFGSSGVFAKGFAALAAHPYIAIATGIAAVVVALDEFGVIDVDWGTLSSALSKIWSVLKKFVKGIGQGLLDFLGHLGEIAGPALEGILNGLAKTLDLIFGVLDSIPPEVIERLGYAVGRLGAAFLAYKAMSSVSRIVGNIAKSFGSLLGLSKTYAIATVATNTASLASGVGTFKTISSSSGIIGKLATSFKSFLGVLAAHPLATMAVGLSAIAVSLYELNSSTVGSEALQEYAEGVDQLAESISENTKEIQEDLNNIDESMNSIDIDNQAESRFLDGLIKEYEDLATKTNLTVFEKQRLRDITDELVEKIPDLSYYIDEETGYLELQGDALDQLIKKQQLNYQMQAYEDLLIEAYRDQVEAEQDLENAIEKRDELWEEYLENTAIPKDILDDLMNTTGEDYTKLIQQIQQDYFNPAISGEELKNKYGFFDITSEDRGLYQLATEIGYLKQNWNALNVEIEDSQEILDGTNMRIQDLTEKLYGSEEAISAIDFATFVVSAGNAIDQASGLWVQGLNGWEQITGEKALEIYKQIQEGLIPENGQGYFETGEGVMYAFGNGIGSAASSAIQTFDSSFLDELNKDLMENGTMLMYQNGQLIVKDLGEGMNNSSHDLKNLTNWIGTESGQGLINGFMSMYNSITGSFLGGAENAVNAIIDFLEIGSPSKLFERIAEFCGLGFANGLPFGMSNALSYIGSIPSMIMTQLDKLNYMMNDIAVSAMQNFSNGIDTNNIIVDFQNLVSSIQNVLSSLYSVGRNAMIGLRNGILSINIPMPHFRFSTNQVKVGNSVISIPEFNLDWYANSGIVSGEIWGMNELGNPEMVGRIGHGSGRTAVANNAIISDAIEAAVERAMSRALMNNGGNSTEYTVMTSLDIDGETIARAVSKGQKRIDYRVNPVKNL